METDKAHRMRYTVHVNIIMLQTTQTALNQYQANPANASHATAHTKQAINTSSIKSKLISMRAPRLQHRCLLHFHRLPLAHTAITPVPIELLHKGLHLGHQRRTRTGLGSFPPPKPPHLHRSLVRGVREAVAIVVRVRAHHWPGGRGVTDVVCCVDGSLHVETNLSACVRKPRQCMRDWVEGRERQEHTGSRTLLSPSERNQAST